MKTMNRLAIFFRNAAGAPARRPMHWMGGLLLLLLAALAMPELHALYVRRRWALPETPYATERTFLALAYSAGTGRDSDSTLEQWHEHLETLKASGFVFIGLREVSALLQEGAPLPKRAVLLMLQLGPEQRRNWAAWQKAAVKSRSRAVVLVDAHSPVPGWRALRRALKTPHWEVAAACPSFVPQMEDLPGAVSAQHRFRTLEQAAMEQLRCIRQVPRRMPADAFARAYAYPARPADGHGGGNHDIRMHLLARNAAPLFSLGFARDRLALNARHSDPLRLNSLAVPPTWTGPDLVQQLKTRGTEQARIETPDGRSEPAALIPYLGVSEADGDGLRMRATGQGLSGFWLAGSNVFDDFDVSFVFSLPRGELRIPFRGATDHPDRWELRLRADGQAALHRIVGGKSQRIARDRWHSAAGGDATPLRMVVRRNRLQAAVNGRGLFNGWVEMQGPQPSGLLGLHLGGHSDAPATVLIDTLRLSPIRPSIALWSGERQTVAHSLEWAGNRTLELTAFSPPIERLDPVDSSDPGAPHLLSILRLAARFHHWDFVPHLNLRRPAELEAWTPEALSDRLAAAGGEGLLVRFAESPDWVMADMAGWLRPLSEALVQQGQRLLLRIPDAMADTYRGTMLLAGIPGIERVVAAASPEARDGGLTLEVPVPEPASEAELHAYFDLMGVERDPMIEERWTRIQQWSDEAEARFGVGDFEGAIEIWFVWHDADPEAPKPLRRIGDALHRLGFHDESVDFYRQSLERDPGNLDLVVFLIQWLDETGNANEARELIQTYTLLFPENVMLLMARAEWLWRRGEHARSRALSLRVLEKEPDHLQAALLMAKLAVSPDEQRAAVNRIVRLGLEPRLRFPVLRAIRDADLLTSPESDALLELLQAPDVSGDTRLSALIEELAPRTGAKTVTSETDTDAPWPSAWRIDGGRPIPDPVNLRIRADAEREVVLVRLSGTERWKDVFIDADIAELFGEVWLTARRSRNHMVRFGFDPDTASLHLQVWERQGAEFQLRQNQVRPFPIANTKRGFRIKLEVRSNGATGFIDGVSWGHHPLALPKAMAPGWVALSLRSISPGQAEAALRRLSAGPIFPVFLHPESPAEGEDLNQLAERLRALSGILTDIGPTGFAIDADGRWSSRVMEKDDFIRLFARYHGLRLLPRVLVHAEAELRIADLLQAAAVHEVDGFLLELERKPPASFFERVNRELRDSPLAVLLTYTEAGTPFMAGVGQARLLVPGAEPDLKIERFPADRPEVWRRSSLEGPVQVTLRSGPGARGAD